MNKLGRFEFAEVSQNKLFCLVDFFIKNRNGLAQFSFFSEIFWHRISFPRSRLEIKFFLKFIETKKLRVFSATQKFWSVELPFVTFPICDLIPSVSVRDGRAKN